jgi:hypothetical protein
MLRGRRAAHAARPGTFMTPSFRLFAALALAFATQAHAGDAPCKHGEAKPGESGALVFSLATVADQPPLFTKV